MNTTTKRRRRLPQDPEAPGMNKKREQISAINRKAVMCRWEKTPKSQRAKFAAHLNDHLTPAELSARNRANRVTGWEKKRKADKLAAKSARSLTNSEKSEHFT